MACDFLTAQAELPPSTSVVSRASLQSAARPPVVPDAPRWASMKAGSQTTYRQKHRVPVENTESSCRVGLHRINPTFSTAKPGLSACPECCQMLFPNNVLCLRYRASNEVPMVQIPQADRYLQHCQH